MALRNILAGITLSGLCTVFSCACAANSEAPLATITTNKVTIHSPPTIKTSYNRQKKIAKLAFNLNGFVTDVIYPCSEVRHIADEVASNPVARFIHLVNIDGIMLDTFDKKPPALKITGKTRDDGIYEFFKAYSLEIFSAFEDALAEAGDMCESSPQPR